MLEKIQRIIADQLDLDEVEESELDEDTKLVEDLDADSLDIVEIIIAVETEFNITIDDDEAHRETETIGDLIKLIESKV